MNSKRALYKPVTSGKENIRERRKPLAQGRLVTDHAGGKTEDRVNGTHLAQGQAAANHNAPSHCEPLASFKEDPAISPRRETPQISFHDSPRVVKPSQSLDVSDVESELNFSSNFSPRNVLVVSARTPSPREMRTTEVALDTHLSSSPARVVCHTPGKVHADLRDTGDVGLAAQINVDKPERVNIVSEEDATYPTEILEPHTPERKPAASAPPRVTVSVASEGEECEQESQKHSAKPKKKKSSHTVESRYMSHFGGSVTAKGPMKAFGKGTAPAVKGSVLKPVRTAKKSSSSTVGASDRSHTSRKVAASTSAASTRYAGTPDMKTYKTGGGGGAGGGGGGSRGSSHPRPASVERKSSTPTAESSAMPETADISAIGPPSLKLHTSNAFASPSFEGSIFDMRSPQSAKKKLGFASAHHSSSHPKSAKKSNSSRLTNTNTSTNTTAMTSSLSVCSQNNSTRPQNKGHVSQTELDMTYARLLQWVYPYASLKYGVREREKHFMVQLAGIREENESLRQRKNALEVELAQLQHRNALDEAISVQESGLSLVCSSLPEFHHQYHTLAASLDTTRHQIPTVDILIPDCHEDFTADLDQCLCESERLLAELDLMSRERVPGVTQCAKSLDLMSADLQAQLRETGRCTELLAAAGILSDREASLQTMQLLSGGENSPAVSTVHQNTQS